MIFFYQQYCDFTLILNMLTYQSEKMIQTKSQNLAIFYGYSCFVYILQLTNLQTYKLTNLQTYSYSSKYKKADQSHFSYGKLLYVTKFIRS